MEILKESPFGDMHIHTVYSFYDRPIMYSASSGIVPDLFFVNLVDWDESTQTNIWLYLPISIEELCALESKTISPQQLMTSFRSPNFYIVKEDDIGCQYEVGDSASEFNC